MRQRTGARLPNRATITRREKIGENEIGEPIYEQEQVAEGAPCAFDDGSTEFVREDSGERVNKPATVRFEQDVSVLEGDTVDIESVGQTFEARGVERTRDHRRGRIISLSVELERVD